MIVVQMYNYYYYYFISAHKSDLSNPWSQTQASLSIPSHTNTNTNKRREREEKNNRRENLPRSDRRGREKNKTRPKTKKANIFRLLIGVPDYSISSDIYRAFK